MELHYETGLIIAVIKLIIGACRNMSSQDIVCTKVQMLKAMIWTVSIYAGNEDQVRQELPFKNPLVKPLQQELIPDLMPIMAVRNHVFCVF